MPNLIIEFNSAAFDHGVGETDIYRAFDTAVYDGLLDEPDLGCAANNKSVAVFAQTASGNGGRIETGTYTDPRDGEVYRTVKIGNLI